MASKPSPPTPVSKELPATQQTRNRQAEERLDDEPSISSGSETDRENDQSDDDEVLSHFSGASLNLLAFYFCTYLLYLIKGECPLLYCLYFLKLVFTKKSNGLLTQLHQRELVVCAVTSHFSHNVLEWKNTSGSQNTDEFSGVCPKFDREGSEDNKVSRQELTSTG